MIYQTDFENKPFRAGMTGGQVVEVARQLDRITSETGEVVCLSLMQVVKDFPNEKRDSFLDVNPKYKELFIIIDSHNKAVGEPRIQAQQLEVELNDYQIVPSELLALLRAHLEKE